jgi:hypothetical protein
VSERSQIGSGAIIALAGRRIDPAGADTGRFPLANVPLVRKRLAELFIAERATALVCSAACGADLVALEEAERLSLRRRIVLPFVPERFRETSVVDRPGDWGPVFDRLIEVARSTGDLVVLDRDSDNGDDAYAAANRTILKQARSVVEEGGGARPRLVAVIVWEGAARSGSDASEGFRSLAATADFTVRFVLTV